MGNKSSKKSILDKKDIIHPNYTKNATLSQSSMNKSEIDPNLSNFSLSSQSNLNLSIDCKQLWLIRHGERMDEVGSNEANKWRNNTSKARLFDPPLTKNGYKQSRERGNILLKQLSEFKDNNNEKINYYPKYIYSSPTERTIGTAMSIALILKLPIIIIPGLASCAAAVKRGGLIKKNININNNNNNNNKEMKYNDDDQDEGDWELFLENYGWIGQCRFLTKKEILKKFGKNNVKILFDYKYIEKFEKSVQRLTIESETNIILCVTHREGIRYLDDRLIYSRIPYCALAKYIFVTNSKVYSKGFVYFEDEEK